MKRIGNMTSWTLGLLLLGLLGCEKYVLSLHPLHTPADRVFEPDLVGKWYSEDDTWEFSQDEEGDYHVRMAQPLALGHFKGRLLRLGGTEYMDLTPTAVPDWPQTTGHYDAHFVTTHTIMQLDREASGFQLSRLKVDPLKEMLEKDPNLISHVPHGDHLLVTGVDPASEFLDDLKE